MIKLKIILTLYCILLLQYRSVISEPKVIQMIRLIFTKDQISNELILTSQEIFEN